MQPKFLIATVIVLVLLGGGVYFFEQSVSDVVMNGAHQENDQENPQTLIGELPSFEPETSKINEVSESGREIFETNGIRHSIPLSELVGGGPPKDGIPSIDDPRYVSISEAATWMEDDDTGITVEINGQARFYPYRILVWHEIVNDIFEGQPILVTYCPLCLSGVVYIPEVDGQRVEFGTSGRLWQSNLVMYDRKTDSLWSQILGEAIVGPKTGQALEFFPSDVNSFKGFRDSYPDGEVLSRDTGEIRNYNDDPYGSYYTDDRIFSSVSFRDDRLDIKEVVMGINVFGKTKAYVVDQVKEQGTITDQIGQTTIQLEYDSGKDTVRVFELRGQEKVRLPALPNFWFSWVAAHPDTDLYQ